MERQKKRTDEGKREQKVTVDGIGERYNYNTPMCLLYMSHSV